VAPRPSARQSERNLAANAMAAVHRPVTILVVAFCGRRLGSSRALFGSLHRRLPRYETWPRLLRFGGEYRSVFSRRTEPASSHAQRIDNQPPQAVSFAKVPNADRNG